MKEVTIVLKDDSQTLREDFVVHEDFSMSTQDPVLMSLVQKVVVKFQGKPDSVTLKVKMEI